MQKARAGQLAADRRQLEQEIHLVKAPGALAKDKEQKLKGAAAQGRGRACMLLLPWPGPGWSGLGLGLLHRSKAVHSKARVLQHRCCAGRAPTHAATHACLLPCSCCGGDAGRHAGVSCRPLRLPPLQPASLPRLPPPPPAIACTFIHPACARSAFAPSPAARPLPLPPSCSLLLPHRPPHPPRPPPCRSLCTRLIRVRAVHNQPMQTCLQPLA